MTELHALRQALLTETGHDADQLDAALFRPVPFGRPLLEIAAHFADNDDGLGLRIVFKHLEIAHVVRAGIGIAADADRGRDAVGKLRADPDDLVGETAGFGNDAERSLTIELGENQIVEGAADHAQPAGPGRDDADGRRAVEHFPEFPRVSPQELGVLFGHAFGDHGDDFDVRIVERFHAALHRTIGADIDQARVDRGMILGGFCDGLVDGNGDEPTAIGNFIGLTGIRRIDERFNVERPLDQVTELRHAPRSVHAGLPALNDDAGVLVGQNTHRNLPLFLRS